MWLEKMLRMFKKCTAAVLACSLIGCIPVPYPVTSIKTDQGDCSLRGCPVFIESHGVEIRVAVVKDYDGRPLIQDAEIGKEFFINLSLRIPETSFLEMTQPYLEIRTEDNELVEQLPILWRNQWDGVIENSFVFQVAGGEPIHFNQVVDLPDEFLIRLPVFVDNSGNTIMFEDVRYSKYTSVSTCYVGGGSGCGL